MAERQSLPVRMGIQDNVCEMLRKMGTRVRRPLDICLLVRLPVYTASASPRALRADISGYMVHDYRSPRYIQSPHCFSSLPSLPNVASRSKEVISDEHPLAAALDELVEHQAHVCEGEATDVEGEELGGVAGGQLEADVGGGGVLQAWVFRLTRDLICGGGKGQSWRFLAEAPRSGPRRAPGGSLRERLYLPQREERDDLPKACAASNTLASALMYVALGPLNCT